MSNSTNSEVGMAVAAPSKSMQDGGWVNDTRKKKWSVDTTRDPKHIDVLDNFPGGTKFTFPANTAGVSEEILLAIKHEMPFPPQFLCYFYTKDAPAGWSKTIGNYTQGHGLMMYNAFTLGEETIYAEVDEEYFYIKHRFESFGFNSATATAFGGDYKFRIRYELLNIPAFRLTGLVT